MITATLKSVTPGDIRAMLACYSDERVAQLWAGRERLAARDIMSLGIPAHDRVWCLVRMLNAPGRAAFAQWCADRASNAPTIPGANRATLSAFAAASARDYAEVVIAGDVTAAPKAADYAIEAADYAVDAACGWASYDNYEYCADAERTVERRVQLNELVRMIEASE